MKNLNAGIVAMAEANEAVSDDAPAPDSAEASGHGALTLDSAVDNLETITPDAKVTTVAQFDPNQTCELRKPQPA